MEELQKLTYLNGLSLDLKPVHMSDINKSYGLLRKLDAASTNHKANRFIIDLNNSNEVMELLKMVRL